MAIGSLQLTEKGSEGNEEEIVRVINRRLKPEELKLPMCFRNFLFSGLSFGILQLLNKNSENDKPVFTSQALLFLPSLLFYPLLHTATIFSSEIVLRNLLRGGELYSLDFDGNTPLYYALVADNEACTRILLDHFKQTP